ncbi:MAG: hypothetical protein AB7U45_08285 [Desulfamplus sp.]
MINLNAAPLFEYYISGVSEPLAEESPLLKIPLLGRDAGGILLSEYFLLAEIFIKSDNYRLLKDGLQFVLSQHESAESHSFVGINISEIINNVDIISIYLEKHGAFYHPARVEVSFCKPSAISPISFVLNTAVSPHGLALIHNEYNLLKYINNIDENFSVPKVFGVETMTCRGMQLSFLLGTWFDGYKEFHLTNIQNSDLPDSYDMDNTASSVLNLWNSDGTVIPVYSPYYFEIYEKASEILTWFYNIRTFQHIWPWHHAAGDFVVKPIYKFGCGKDNFEDKSKSYAAGAIEHFDVKLITVRGYGSIVELEPYNIDDNSIEDIYKSLLLFFLNLTLRMRIDRFDGVGERALVDADVIPFIIKGFFKAVDKKLQAVDNVEKSAFIDGFKLYFKQFSHENLYQIFLVMIDMMDSPEKEESSSSEENPEIIFIKKHLKSHSEILSYYICNY